MIPVSVWSSLGEEKEGQKEKSINIIHLHPPMFLCSSFDSKFVYQQRGLGPIEQNTILVLNPSNAKLLRSTGKNL